jgi:antitoxin component YwqK of YwqJK toxin-antitoxin module
MKGRFMNRRTIHLAVAVFAASAIALGGCATSGTKDSAPQDPVAAPGSDPDPGASQSGGGGGPLISVGRRAQSAVEGLVIGAAIGAQAGPIGAAVGAGTFLIYGALTGHSPLGGQPGYGGGYGGGYGSVTSEERREAALEEQIAQEAARGDVLEDEIGAELERQEELLRQIDREESAPAPTQKETAPDPVTDSNLAERADPRVAASAPKDRQLPLAIFEKEEVTVPAGEWGNDKKLKVVKRSLDADQDGKPEQIRYYDRSGDIIRKEQDQDFDGQIDTWSIYRQESLRERVIDANGDGQLDVWETYETGKMTGRQVDRDHDGVRDAFYTYERGSLVEERHDADNDGKMDVIVTYENRHRVRTEEDRDKNGRIDMWITYQIVDGAEVVNRVEKDETGDGKPNIFETFTAKSGKPVLTKREEDKNGDGNIDVTSIYKNGKLVRREISDPNMVPL